MNRPLPEWGKRQMGEQDLSSRNGILYLDHNATTPVSPSVLEAMMPYLTECYANPSSPFPEGETARDAVRGARERVARFLKAKTGEIVFTSGGTESNHAAILSALANRPDRRKIVSTPYEHPSVMKLLEDLGGKGYTIAFLPGDPSGRVSEDAIERTVCFRTALVIVMWANNETGVLQPVGRAAEIARRAGALMHSDAVAAAGKVPVDLSKVGVDTLSLSGHKIYGPKGTGVLFCRKSAPFRPLFFGTQERKLRGGTENVPGIAGLGQAALEADAFLNSDRPVILGALRDRLENAVLEMFPDARVNGDRAPGARVPHVANLRPGSFSAEKWQERLLRKGIRAATGSACSSGSMEPSATLLAMGLDREEALESLRFSLGKSTGESDLDFVLWAMERIGQEEGLFLPEKAGQK